MADKTQAEKDLKRAEEIVRNKKTILGGGFNSMRKTIAMLVARALAEGREEGIKIREARAKGKPDG